MHILLRLSALLLLIALISCNRQANRLFKETRSAMYTVTSISVAAPNEAAAKEAIDAAFRELQRLEDLLNYHSDKSEISAINRNAGIKPVSVSPETMEIIEKSLSAAALTEGGFDITMGPVISLWDFKAKRMPDDAHIKKALSRVGYKDIQIDCAAKTVYLRHRGMEINLGGIIKGYAAEKTSELLKGMGIKGGIVSIGGDIKAFGLRPDGKGWNVGIQEPRPKMDKDELLGSIAISDRCISTSGDYEKFFEKEGKRYHHILDPKTGMPSQGIRSITVIASNGAFCDALSTGLFILPPDRALLRMRQEGIEGLIIDDKGQMHMTEWFENNLKRGGA